MRYGDGFWVVKDGARVRDRRDAYPELLPFEYDDGTGDCGWFTLAPFTFDYVKPGDGSGMAWRFTVAGCRNPNLSSSMDFDGASVPQNPLVRVLVHDKMDHRWIVPAFGHDLGYCIHGYGTGFTKSDWDRFLLEVSEAYGAGWADRNKYWGVVAAVGGFAWKKTPEETEHYCDLVKVAKVPV